MKMKKKRNAEEWEQYKKNGGTGLVMPRFFPPKEDWINEELMKHERRKWMQEKMKKIGNVDEPDWNLLYENEKKYNAEQWGRVKNNGRIPGFLTPKEEWIEHARYKWVMSMPEK